MLVGYRIVFGIGKMVEEKGEVKEVHWDESLIRGYSEYKRSLFRSLVKKSDLTPNGVKDIFSEALERVGASYRSLSVEPSPDLNKIVEMGWSRNKKIRFRYNDLLFRAYNKEQIEQILLHEACRYMVQPKIKIPEGSSEDIDIFFENYATIYKEYLADAEFNRRFPDHTPFFAYKLQQQIYSRTLIKYIGYLKTQKIIPDAWSLAQWILGILYNAIYFFEAYPEAIQVWCTSLHLNMMHRYFSWIYEDFKTIKSLAHREKDLTTLLQISALSAVSVEASPLIYNDRLVFKTKKLGQEVHEGMETSKQVINAWEKRRQEGTKS